MQDWIQTFTGKKIDPLAPDYKAIDIVDIAHALSLKCRFNGQCSAFYSVAEHSVRVSQILRPDYALHGLLHDAAEAYLPDIPSPLKGSFFICGPYDQREKFVASVQDNDGLTFDKTFCAKLGTFKYWEDAVLLPLILKTLGVTSCGPKSTDAVRRADRILLATEARDLMRDPTAGSWDIEGVTLPEVIDPLDSTLAEFAFLSQYRNFTGTDQTDREKEIVAQYNAENSGFKAMFNAPKRRKDHAFDWMFKIVPMVPGKPAVDHPLAYRSLAQ